MHMFSGFEVYLEELSKQFLVKEEGIFYCTICGQSAKRKNDATLHVESKHFPSDKGYSCGLCDKRLNTYRAYKVHRQAYHKQTYHG